MYPVILAGGSGERLWPLSRSRCPKQFLPLNGERTMLQETVARLKQVDTVNVICNEEHRFLAAEQMRQMGQKCSVLLEPVGRNTAPAIALAALNAEVLGPNSEVRKERAEVRSRMSEVRQERAEVRSPMSDVRKEEEQDQSVILLVLAADHVIENVAAFRDAVALAEPLAEAGKLVTFGIVPTNDGVRSCLLPLSV